jgi:hypothetical protein
MTSSPALPLIAVLARDCGVIYGVAMVSHRPYIPVGLSSTVLLGLLGVLAGGPVLREVAREMLRRSCGAVSKTGMVLIVELVRASHLQVEAQIS